MEFFNVVLTVVLFLMLNIALLSLCAMLCLVRLQAIERKERKERLKKTMEEDKHGGQT